MIYGVELLRGPPIPRVFPPFFPMNRGVSFEVLSDQAAADAASEAFV